MHKSEQATRQAGGRSISRAVDPSVEQSIHQSTHLPISRAVDPSIHPSIHQSTHPSINPPVYPSIDPSIHQSTHLSINRPIHPSIHPSIHDSNDSCFPDSNRRAMASHSLTRSRAALCNRREHVERRNIELFSDRIASDVRRRGTQRLRRRRQQKVQAVGNRKQGMRV